MWQYERGADWEKDLPTANDPEHSTDVVEVDIIQEALQHSSIDLDTTTPVNMEEGLEIFENVDLSICNFSISDNAVKPHLQAVKISKLIAPVFLLKNLSMNKNLCSCHICGLPCLKETNRIWPWDWFLAKSWKNYMVYKPLARGVVDNTTQICMIL
jgi:hypothetical protein